MAKRQVQGGGGVLQWGTRQGEWIPVDSPSSGGSFFGCFVAGKESVRLHTTLHRRGNTVRHITVAPPQGPALSWPTFSVACTVQGAGASASMWSMACVWGGGGGQNRSIRGDSCSPSSREFVLWGGGGGAGSAYPSAHIKRKQRGVSWAFPQSFVVLELESLVSLEQSVESEH